MNPYSLTFLCLAAAIFAAVLPYIIGARALKRKATRADELVRDARLARDIGLLVDDEPESPALRAARERFRSEPEAAAKYRAGPSFGFDKTGYRTDPRLVRHNPRTPSIFIPSRDLTHVNVMRKGRGYQPLSRAGFAAATAHRWDRPDRQPETNLGWLNYYLLFEALTPDHTSSSVHVDTGITITPDAPYNGHGGDFGGAGATSSWSDTPAQAATAASVDPYAAVAARISSDPAYSPSLAVGLNADSQPVDMYNNPVPAQSPASDPAPSYSAPDPAPSYTPDTSSVSSPSVDMPSFDAGSSS